VERPALKLVPLRPGSTRPVANKSPLKSYRSNGYQSNNSDNSFNSDKKPVPKKKNNFNPAPNHTNYPAVLPETLAFILSNSLEQA
jgi:hypothetical protein